MSKRKRDEEEKPLDFEALKRRKQTSIFSFGFANSRQPLIQAPQSEEPESAASTSSEREIEPQSRPSSDAPPSSLSAPENDIGHAFSPTFDHSNRPRLFRLLNETWIPGKDHQLPSYKPPKGRERPFQHNWLSGPDSFSWLAYSSIFNGGFCKKCVLFPALTTEARNLGKQRVLTKLPFNGHWIQHGRPELREHEASDSHIQSVKRVSEFERRYKGEVDDIKDHLNDQFRTQEKAKRELMGHIVSATKFLLQQGLAFRGKDEKRDSNNRGNFLEFLEFLGENYSCELKKHLENPSDLNATHLSPESQNELISIIGDKIQQEILNEIKEAGFYSVLADGSTDKSKKEQLSLVLRYIKDNMVQEQFMAFIDMKETTGEALADAILGQLSKWGLDLHKLRGQGYDGASNMAGKNRGCQALINKLYYLALYTHCCSHRLNLVIIQTCDEPAIRNMLGIVLAIATFIHESAKRLNIFEKNLPSDSGRKRLKLLCLTRWVERADALTTFLDLLEPITDALDEMSTDRSQTSSTATAHLKSICNFEFLITLVCVEKLLAFSLPVVRYLQLKNLDLIAASKAVKDGLESMQSWRQNGEARFRMIFQKAKQIANKLEVLVEKPRLTVRQTKRANPPAGTAEDYYRITIFNTMCDHFIREMTERFEGQPMIAFLASLFIPTKMQNMDDLSIQEETKPLIEMYRSDLPSPSQIDTEITTWVLSWSKADAEERPSTVLATLEKCPVEQYPNIRQLLLILAVLPVTTCENERSFSTLKRLKTYLRSTMSQERLVGCALATIHKEKTKKLEIQGIVDDYCSKKNRRGIANL